MTFSRTVDFLLSIITTLFIVMLVAVNGDALYIGAWYYIVVPLIIFAACSIFRPAPLFLFGTAIAIAISMFAYLYINRSSSRPEGLLGLGHLLSLPGAFVVVLVAASFVRKKQIAHPFIAFLFGFIGYGVGFFINQLLICNTLMWCGLLSLEYYR
jgi:hypothetical protein